MKVNLNDLKLVYEEEIRKKVKNKRKIFLFERNKMEYLCEMKKQLENGIYNGGNYNIFVIFHPKTRVVMSQGIFDKTINHYVTRFILMPKFEKYLSPYNCATRKNMGTSYALKMLKKILKRHKKGDKDIYYAKLDISKYFYSINHHKMLSLLKSKLTAEEFNLMKTILQTTNKAYVNERINYFSQKYNLELPYYKNNYGLPIGNMTSQFLAIFYLSKLHHYITHDLHLDFINYMDDYIFISNNKDYLKECLQKIINIIEQEYLLKINGNKTYIAKLSNGLPFLGYNFYVKNNKTIIKLLRNTKHRIKKGIKKSIYDFKNNLFDYNQIFCSIETYKHSHSLIKDYSIENIKERYWY